MLWDNPGDVKGQMMNWFGFNLLDRGKRPSVNYRTNQNKLRLMGKTTISQYWSGNKIKKSLFTKLSQKRGCDKNKGKDSWRATTTLRVRRSGPRDRVELKGRDNSLLSSYTSTVVIYPCMVPLFWFKKKTTITGQASARLAMQRSYPKYK